MLIMGTMKTSNQKHLQHPQDAQPVPGVSTLWPITPLRLKTTKSYGQNETML